MAKRGTVGKVKVVLNDRGYRALLHAPEVKADLMRRMERVKASAEALAPVSKGPRKVHYRDTLELDATPPKTGSRARVRLYANSGHAMDVEANHGVLARAFDAAGGAS